MSADGRFHALGADDWVEQLRNAGMREPATGVEEAGLEAAYNASEIDSALMFAYFEGRLTEAERRDLEAEIALSPQAFNKLARIGAIVAKSQAGETRFISEPLAAAAASFTEPEPVVHRVKLSGPKPSLGGHSLPRSEDCLRDSADSSCEFYRSIEKERDQLRIFHHAAPVGTLVEVRISKPDDPSGAAFTQFAVLRPSSEITTTATMMIPDSFRRGDVILELIERSAEMLTAEKADSILQSYHKAAIEDPVAVTPLHEPRSAWQIWADQVLKTPIEKLDPAVRDVAERIAGF